MGRFVTIAQRGSVPEGSGVELTVEGRIIALYRVGEEFFALDGICPHAGGPLGQGQLNDCIVTCPWHGWQFDVSTGTHCLNNRLRQTTYAVRIDGDAVQVELPE
ncbi:MAG: Rieske 2Fe-2S domain-containing protein [Planctomycetaceae bacterium]|nr:Rieske 2Fe-2S domain-containing protein [Planctomycetaceae bacterium]